MSDKIKYIKKQTIKQKYIKNLLLNFNRRIFLSENVESSIFSAQGVQ